MKLKLFLTIFCVLYLDASYSQNLPFLLDGLFDDWKNTEVIKDASGDGTAIDFLEAGIANDSRYLIIRIKVTEEFELTNNNKVSLYIDGDNNSLTGTSVNGIGAELRIYLGDRKSTTHFGGFTKQYTLNNIGFLALPTVSGTEFEIALPRELKLAGNSLFQGNVCRILLRDHSQSNGDLLPNSGSTLSYTFGASTGSSYQSLRLEKASPTYMRLLTYNVLNDGLDDLKRVDQFKRIIKAIHPDIITFNECWNTKPNVVASFMNGVLPLPNFQNWQAIKIDAGNITVSRYPILQNWEIRPNSRQTASLIDLPQNFTTDLLIVNAHLRCCTADTERQLEADAFVNFILDAKTPGGKITLPPNTPFVLSGDLNLVGKRQQLTTILNGQIVNSGTYGPGGPLDWDGSSLLDIISIHTDAPVAYTWKDAGNEFPPSRIDYHVASASVVTIVKSFTLDTETMPAAKLTEYGLVRTDTEIASDHLPKVTDLILPFSTNESEVPTTTFLLKVFPNPFHDFLNIQLFESSVKPLEINLRDVSGRLLRTQQAITADGANFRLEISDVNPGMYFLEIRSGDFVVRQKLVKH